MISDTGYLVKQTPAGHRHKDNLDKYNDIVDFKKAECPHPKQFTFGSQTPQVTHNTINYCLSQPSVAQ
jgi:hypothetical protein